MKKELQKEWEMQDDELYALLDSAMEDDRLCVSEDLIQRTLQRVKEEDRTATVTSRKPRSRVWISYAGVAAAALLVVFVGTKSINNVSKESADMAAPRSEASKAMDDGTYYSSSAECGGSANGAASTNAMDNSDMVKDEAGYSRGQKETPLEREDGIEADVAPEVTESYLRGEEFILSGEFFEFLKKGDFEPEDKIAEYWEFAGEETDMEKQMEEALLTVAVINGPDTIGSYKYTLLDSRGEKQEIASELPLDRIIRIRTDRGELWFLFGTETTYFLK